MKLIQRVIYTGFAAIAITSASMPVWPGYANEERAARDALDDVAIAPNQAGEPPANAFERR
jgi:hypothetical protein